MSMKMKNIDNTYNIRNNCTFDDVECELRAGLPRHLKVI